MIAFLLSLHIMNQQLLNPHVSLYFICSALDSESEKAVQVALDRLMKGKLKLI